MKAGFSRFVSKSVIGGEPVEHDKPRRRSAEVLKRRFGRGVRFRPVPAANCVVEDRCVNRSRLAVAAGLVTATASAHWSA